MLKLLGVNFCLKRAARAALMEKNPVYFCLDDCLERKHPHQHPPSLQYGKGQQSQQPSSTSGVGSSAASAQRAKRRSSTGSQNRKQGPTDDEEQPDSKKRRGRAPDICPASGRCKKKDGQTHCIRCGACTVHHTWCHGGTTGILHYRLNAHCHYRSHWYALFGMAHCYCSLLSSDGNLHCCPALAESITQAETTAITPCFCLHRWSPRSMPIVRLSVSRP